MNNKSKKHTKYAFNYSDNLIEEIPNLEPGIIHALNTKGKKPLQDYVRKITGKDNLKIVYKGILKQPNGVKLPTYSVSDPTKKCVATNVAKKPAPEPVPKKEEKVVKEFFVDVVRGVKYEIRNNAGTRCVQTVQVWADHDIANEPATREDLIRKAENDLLADWFSLFEPDALAETTFKAGKILSRLAHEIEYGEHGPCPSCTREAIKTAEDLLKAARDGFYRHDALLEELKICSCVGVFPNPDEMDKYMVTESGRFVLKNPPKNREKKVSVEVIKSSDLPEHVRKGIEDFIKGITSDSFKKTSK